VVTFEHAYDRVCAALRTLQLLTGESALTGAAYVAQERADEDYEVGSDYLNACWFPYGLAAPSMGAEDMGVFLEQRPGCYFWLGARNEAKGIAGRHHDPAFVIDEDALLIGVEFGLRLIEGQLSAK
jgi:amidohydrolase